jgi:hypothetical protein
MLTEITIKTLVILLIGISLISIFLALYSSFRHTSYGFITKITLYRVTFFLFLFWISGTVAFLISEPKALPAIMFVSIILLVGILINFGLSFMAISRMDKNNLRDKFHQILIQRGKKKQK